jgi:hypothetical protein
MPDPGTNSVYDVWCLFAPDSEGTHEFPLVLSSIGALEHWSIGALEHWSIGALEHWSIGALEHWSIGTLDGETMEINKYIV